MKVEHARFVPVQFYMVQIVCWGRGNLDLKELEGKENKDEERKKF